MTRVNALGGWTAKGINAVTSVLSRRAQAAAPSTALALLAIAAPCSELRGWKPTTRHQFVVAASFRT